MLGQDKDLPITLQHQNPANRVGCGLLARSPVTTTSLERFAMIRISGITVFITDGATPEVLATCAELRKARRFLLHGLPLAMGRALVRLSLRNKSSVTLGALGFNLLSQLCGARRRDNDDRSTCKLKFRRRSLHSI